ncbi:hypothetical protein [Bradyrhizobium liaoningense]|uniref:hypothetical protein n=1 Tax=Bradyrhizobium liaoningense TaxID=43992 RepID=UPI001BAD061F|nr:hypothetical protein [Bradyrhizobium liaoningense]MBR0816933.1 hypothetical protein [Bradyrhizobium liaoningense]
MLRMVLLGLLIPLCVGVLSAMELRTPPRSTVAVVQPQPPAEPNADISDSHGVLAKADRLEVVAMNSERPAQLASVDERVAPPENISIGPSEPPSPIARHRHNPKKVTTTAHPKSKPKATVIKRTAVVQPSKAASDTEPCRLKAFGGLLKALNSTGCEI